MSTSYYLECVDRVIRVLNCFTLEKPELRLVDIAAQVGIHKTQALRIVSTLEAGGYLNRDPDTKRYRLGLELFHLGMIVSEGMDLRRVVHPYLLRLVEETKETARLVVIGEDAPVCIDVVESPQGVRVYAQLGARMPWNAGSSGKVILAYLPESRREEILAKGGFQRFNELTIIDPEILRQEAEVIRERGCHWSTGDLTIASRGIAAPLFNHRGEIVGAISVTAPESRLQGEPVDRLTRLVTQAAAEISRELGYQGSQPKGDGRVAVP